MFVDDFLDERGILEESVSFVNNLGRLVEQEFIRITDLKQLLDYDEVYLFGGYLNTKGYPFGIRYSDCTFWPEGEIIKEGKKSYFPSDNHFCVDDYKDNQACFEIISGEILNLDPKMISDYRQDVFPLMNDFYLTLSDMKIRQCMINEGIVYAKIYNAEDNNLEYLKQGAKCFDDLESVVASEDEHIVVSIDEPDFSKNQNVLDYLRDNFGEYEILTDMQKVSNGDVLLSKVCDHDLYISFKALYVEECQKENTGDIDSDSLRVLKGEVREYRFIYADMNEPRIETPLIKKMKGNVKNEDFDPERDEEIVDASCFLTRLIYRVKSF